MKWDEMTPRERDALVAEKVMGYQGYRVVYSWADRAKKERPEIIFTEGGKSIGDFNTWVDEQGMKIQYGKPHRVYFAPNYTTDISAAWEVVEKMKPTHCFELRVGKFAESARFTAFGPGMKESIAQCKSAPEAICKAALKSVGVDV